MSAPTSSCSSSFSSRRRLFRMVRRARLCLREIPNVRQALCPGDVVSQESGERDPPGRRRPPRSAGGMAEPGASRRVYHVGIGRSRTLERPRRKRRGYVPFLRSCVASHAEGGVWFTPIGPRCQAIAATGKGQAERIPRTRRFRAAIFFNWNSGNFVLHFSLICKAKHTMPTPHYPPAAVQRALRKLGADIRDARRRRHLPMGVVAERAFTSRPTLQKIEAGDTNVSIGIYAAVLQALGLLEGLGQMADISNDRVGQMLASADLPKSVHLLRRKTKS